jgi:bacillaene synthase trans-acting acyltransferase
MKIKLIHSDTKVVFLFSGQGSHYRGMGQKLYEGNAIFRNSLEQSDQIVQKHLHRSLIHELYAEKQQKFDDLLITHPAIVAVEIAMYCVISDLGIKPHYVAGNSLGEFAAGVVSGVWSAEAAIGAAIEQAKSIIRNDISGGMLAVINQKRDDFMQLYSKHDLFLASDNFDGHFTLAGSIGDLSSFQSELMGSGVHFLRLPVSCPFHSPLIEKGRNGFSYFTANITGMLNPQPGFISGIECEEIKVLPENYFWDVVSKYTNFPKMVNYIENKGTCLYIDLGPSGTISNFVKYNLSPLSTSQTLPIMTPFKREDQQLKKLQDLTGR